MLIAGGIGIKRNYYHGRAFATAKGQTIFLALFQSSASKETAFMITFQQTQSFVDKMYFISTVEDCVFFRKHFLMAGVNQNTTCMFVAQTVLWILVSSAAKRLAWSKKTRFTKSIFRTAPIETTAISPLKG